MNGTPTIEGPNRALDGEEPVQIIYLVELTLAYECCINSPTLAIHSKIIEPFQKYRVFDRVKGYLQIV